MGGERPEDNGRALTPVQRNTELIITRLVEYLSIRFDHAARINPGLRQIKQDLMYHELSNVRRCLNSDKIYGPMRVGVSDVFLSDDERKRRGLMSPSDQTSIQVELVSHCQDEKVETTRGQIKIHDLKTFYAAINPALSDFLDLIETWIWWDILDAVEIVRFEQKLARIAALRQGKMPDDVRKRYSMLIHPPSDVNEKVVLATEEEAILYELQIIQTIRDQWATRRQYERGFMFVLHREELPQPNRGEMIHKIAEKVREYDQIESLDALNDDLQHAYATDLRIQPARVTREAVLAHLQEQLIAVEREMLQQADHEQQLGPPLNYKERQLEQIDKWLGDLKAQLKAVGIALPDPAAIAAAAAAAAKAAAPSPSAAPARPAPAPASSGAPAATPAGVGGGGFAGPPPAMPDIDSLNL